MQQDLINDLKGIIDRYIDGHRSRSLSTLARKSGVAYTTLRRFAQREGQPTAEPVLRIVGAVLETEEKLDFIRKYFPDLADALVPIQERNAASMRATDDVLRAFYKRDPHNFIINLCYNDRGSDRTSVERLLGERGLVALDELLAHDILTEKSVDGTVRFYFAPVVICDADTALEQIRFSTQHFDRGLIGSKAARVVHDTSSLTAEAVEKVHAIITKAAMDIVELKNDPANIGDIPIFVDLMMNAYDRSKYLEAKGIKHD